MIKLIFLFYVCVKKIQAMPSWLNPYKIELGIGLVTSFRTTYF